MILVSTVTQQQPQRKSTLVNALIGAVVTVVVSFVPFSPVIGGGVAGYLQHGSREEGVKVGAISGVIATIPVVLGVLLIASVFTIVPSGTGGLGLAVGGLVLALVVFLLAGIYTVGLGAVGGYLGAYLAEERVEERAEE